VLIGFDFLTDLQLDEASFASVVGMVKGSTQLAELLLKGNGDVGRPLN
jgi:hypothetical protein